MVNIDLGGIYFNLFEYLLHYNIFTVNNINEKHIITTNNIFKK